MHSLASFFVLGFSELWGLAVLAKIATSWSSGRYVFGVWDGGMLFGGRSLGRPGTLAFGAGIAALCVANAYLLRSLSLAAAN